MLATEIVVQLTKLIAEHGDRHVKLGYYQREIDRVEENWETTGDAVDAVSYRIFKIVEVYQV